MTRPLRIAVAGLGTVGAATFKLLDRQAELLADLCGRRLVVTAVSARDRQRNRGIDLSAVRWFQDAAEMAVDPETDVMVELIGGADGIARSVCERAIAAGKDVVTANKALLAEHGDALFSQAEAAGARLAFEAAVAGGIPIVKGLREGLAANRIEAVFGILNGTCNYILSEMRTTDREFVEVLSEAQKLGFAETDPSTDIDGLDAAHKLAILAALAFNGLVDFPSIHVEGIRHVSTMDIHYADELGYRIKLLGLAHVTPFGTELRVSPCMVPKGSPIAAVEGVYNAVVARGDSLGAVMMVGRGAGAGPTASAVVADLIDIARGFRVSPLGAPLHGLPRLEVVPLERRTGEYYLRLMVVDRPGVIADVAAHMRDEGVSMEGFIQRGRSPGDAVPVVITTHETNEAAMGRALHKIGELDSVLEQPRMIRIEKLL